MRLHSNTRLRSSTRLRRIITASHLPAKNIALRRLKFYVSSFKLPLVLMQLDFNVLRFLRCHSVHLRCTTNVTFYHSPSKIGSPTKYARFPIQDNVSFKNCFTKVMVRQIHHRVSLAFVKFSSSKITLDSFLLGHFKAHDLVVNVVCQVSRKSCSRVGL